MSIKLKGSSDGSVSFDAPADTSPSGSDITLVLPTTVGSAEQFLKNSGTAGTLEFSSMVETSTGVGIGTSSPSAKLHANSGSTDVVADFESGDANAWIQIRDNSTTDTAVMVGAVGDDMRLRAGSNERVRIDSSGNVGIGTTSPGSFNSDGRNLVVGTGSGGQGMSIYSGNSSYGTIYFADGTSGDALYQGAVLYNHSSHFMRLDTAGAERMRIDSSGKVGIGTASPASKIHLSGGAENVLIQTTNSTGDAFFGIRNGSYGLLGTGDAYIYTNDGDVALIADGASDVIKFAAGGNSERMRIDSSGNVGIGTSSPTQKLDVRGSVYVGTSIGINTTSPSSKLHALNPSGGADTTEVSTIERDNSGYFIKLYRNAGSGNVGGLIGADSVGTYFTGGHNTTNNRIYIDSVNDKMLFSTNNSERMRIDSSGRLLIGTTTEGNASADQLTVADSGDCGITIRSGTGSRGALYFSDATSGSGEFDGYIIYEQNNKVMRFATDATERMRIDSSGNLLLGTTSATGGTSSGDFVVEFTGNSANAIKTRDTDNTGTVNHMVFVSGSALVGSISGTTGAASFNNLSDYRRKENDVEIADGIQKIKLLRPIRFNYISDPNTVCDGFFAHEVTPAVPTAVTGAKDAVDSEGEIDPQMLDTSKLVPLLTAALQEAIAKIETLETKVAALEAQ